MPGMTARHRKCILNASMGGPNGENEAQLYTGAKVRQECLDLGWIERLQDSPAGFRMYGATPLGRSLLSGPPAKKDPPRLRTLKPRIPTMKNRFAEKLKTRA